LGGIFNAISFLYHQNLVPTNISHHIIKFDQLGNAKLQIDNCVENGQEIFMREWLIKDIPELKSVPFEGEMMLIIVTKEAEIYSMGMCVQELLHDDPEAIEFSRLLTKENPQERLTIEDILVHPFIAPYIQQASSPISSPIFAPPLSWSVLNCDHDEYKLVEVNQPLFEEISEFMRSTWEGDKIGKGRDGNGMDHKNFEIKKIWRVENSRLWRNYCNKKDSLMVVGKMNIYSRWGKRTSCWDAVQKLGGIENVTSKNECILFHGAPSNSCSNSKKEEDDGIVDKVNIITKQGFDERIGSGGLFGNGIYFSSKSSKADCYGGRPNGRDESSVGETVKMIISRVCMGNFHTTSHGSGDLKRPPCIQGCQPTISCDHKRYDSVFYDGTGRNYEEFIIYDRDQVYPEYVIEYERTN